MIQVTTAEAQARLPELLEAVRNGESVEIHPDSETAFVLVPIPKPVEKSKPWPGYPQAGSLEGRIWMADDFDEPLEEFREYWG